ncbi:hypothetical protein PASE110613_01440 [Paenibacillus sediminis]|uniref:Uncharacterized protein n=1 Tax=Paenibacillus sediminis TaxID=664909 RepID=A0ABS4GZP8_9BACL|nr:hypothetical protein [Paenibacillus sediminis]MBP1935753.1 hypothetical protein [Paenibacillus sediminis]
MAYQPAHLQQSELTELQQYEQKLREMTGQPIILIAYTDEQARTHHELHDEDI